MGGGVFPNPKTFVILPSNFWHAKVFLRCYNMFYKRGEVISDQFYHLKVIGFRVLVVLFWREKIGKHGTIWEFFFTLGYC